MGNDLIDSCVWTHGPQRVVLLWKVVKPLGSGRSLSHWRQVLRHDGFTPLPVCPILLNANAMNGPSAPDAIPLLPWWIHLCVVTQMRTVPTIGSGIWILVQNWWHCSGTSLLEEVYPWGPRELKFLPYLLHGACSWGCELSSSCSGHHDGLVPLGP